MSPAGATPTLDDNAPITQLLQRIRNGDRAAESQLMPLVYERLHRAAVQQFKSERPDHTLQPTALISEVYLRIIRGTTVDWQSRAHFYAVSARTMRRILVDHARAADAQRRPPRGAEVDIENVLFYTNSNAYELLFIDDMLNQLAALDPRQAQIVELRVFGGLTVEETAHVVGISERTVKRDWTMARAWFADQFRISVDEA
jgi:RNA polymerase sigma factor (TIGR02999 family)